MDCFSAGGVDFSKASAGMCVSKELEPSVHRLEYRNRVWDSGPLASVPSFRDS